MELSTYTLEYQWKSGLKVTKSMNFKGYRKAASHARMELRNYPMLDRIVFINEDGQKFSVER